MPSILLRATTLGLAGLAMVGAAAAQQVADSAAGPGVRIACRPG